MLGRSTSSAVHSSTDGGTTGCASTSTSFNHPALHVRIAKRFRIVRHLGGGAFGEVYVGLDMVTEEYVAMKLEPILTMHQPHLQHEARLYHYLTRGLVTVGIPRLRYFGREGDFNVLVMDLLGPSLEDLFDFCGRTFSLKTICMIVEQMISRLEYFHNLAYLHRDLKPENFVMGVGRRAHHVYLIDLGLAKRWRDPRTGEHIPYLDGKALTGTARYVSINTHLGQQQSRRDDLESVSIIAVYFAKGGLPWQGVRCATKLGKYEKIKNMKIGTSVSRLCEGLPSAFAEFVSYTRGLAFEEAPNYDQCRGYFQSLLHEELMEEHDFLFDWIELSRKDDGPSLSGTGEGAAVRSQKEATHNTGGESTGIATGFDGPSFSMADSVSTLASSPKRPGPLPVRRAMASPALPTLPTALPPNVPEHGEKLADDNTAIET